MPERPIWCIPPGQWEENMNEQSEGTKDIILEFCRSQGAPTAHWLGGLSPNGQRECIRHWIIRSRSPEIYRQTHAVVERLFEESTSKDKEPYFYDAQSAEEVLDRVERARRHARERLDREIRFGAICIEEIDSPQPQLEYNRYRDVCDEEWKLTVEGKQTTRNPWYPVLAWLLAAAAALIFEKLYLAVWCVVLGSLHAILSGGRSREK